MVLGNKISRFFKGLKQKFDSFTHKKTDDAVSKNTAQRVSESVSNGKRKRKQRSSRWSKYTWLIKISRLTWEKLSGKDRVYLAKNWFGNFRPVGKFNFKRGSKTLSNSEYARRAGMF